MNIVGIGVGQGRAVGAVARPCCGLAGAGPGAGAWAGGKREALGRANSALRAGRGVTLSWYAFWFLKPSSQEHLRWRLY